MIIFEQYYECYSSAFIFRDDLELTNRIILPISALTRLTMLEVTMPMVFKVVNPETSQFTHCGVLEFSADENRCYMPSWVMKNLLLRDGQTLLIKNVVLQKGTKIKLQPSTTTFITNIYDPKEALEQCLKNFSCLTKGDIFDLHAYGEKYEIEALECEPEDAILVINADIEVDFEAPKDYVDESVSSTSTKKTEIAQSYEKLSEDEWRNRIPNGVITYCSSFKKKNETKGPNIPDKIETLDYFTV